MPKICYKHGVECLNYVCYKYGVECINLCPSSSAHPAVPQQGAGSGQDGENAHGGVRVVRGTNSVIKGGKAEGVLEIRGVLGCSTALYDERMSDLTSCFMLPCSRRKLMGLGWGACLFLGGVFLGVASLLSSRCPQSTALKIVSRNSTASQLDTNTISF